MSTFGLRISGRPNLGEVEEEGEGSIEIPNLRIYGARGDTMRFLFNGSTCERRRSVSRTAENRDLRC